MKHVFHILPLLCLLLQEVSVQAQQLSASTNAVEWANLGTVNAELGWGFSQHFSLHAGLRYNNWNFKEGTAEQFQNRKQAYQLSLRYWFWYINTGWWLRTHAQWMEYNRGGLFHSSAEEGDAIGGGLGLGYTYLLAKHLNLEVGASVWAGRKDYKIYRCTHCGSVQEQGQRFFVLPDDVFASLVFVF